MSLALVVTAGFGNGTLGGTVKDAVTRGYTIGTIIATADLSFGVLSRISANDVSALSAISALDTAAVSEMEQNFSVYSRISSRDTVVTSDINGDPTGLESEMS